MSVASSELALWLKAVLREARLTNGDFAELKPERWPIPFFGDKAAPSRRAEADMPAFVASKTPYRITRRRTSGNLNAKSGALPHLNPIRNDKPHFLRHSHGVNRLFECIHKQPVVGLVFD